MTRFIRSCVGLAVGAAFLFGVTASATAAEVVKVRMDWLAWAMHSPFHLAKAKGWYSDAGLDVTVDDGDGSVKTVQYIGAGNYDIGFAGQATMVAGVVKGVPVKAIAGVVRRNEMGIVVPRESGWKTPKDLTDNNVRVVVSGGSFEAPFLAAFFRNGGTDVNKVNFVTVGAAHKGSTYISKGADAMISGPAYWKPILESKRPSSSIMMADFDLEMPGTGIIAGNRIIEERPEVVRKFIAVSMQSLKYIYDGHFEEAVDALIKARPNAKIPRAINLARFEEYRDLLVTDATKGKPWGYMAPRDWEVAIKNMKDAGVVPAKFKATDFYTNKFVPTVTQ